MLFGCFLGILKKFRFPSQASYGIVALTGKRFKFGVLSLKVLPASDSCSRFCFVIKKKYGNAVFRNRCRRILRSAFFSEAKKLKFPFWIMAMVEMSESNANWKELRNSVYSAIKELGIIENEKLIY